MALNENEETLASKQVTSSMMTDKIESQMSMVSSGVSQQVRSSNPNKSLQFLDLAIEIQQIIFYKYYEDATPMIEFPKDSDSVLVKGIPKLDLELTCKQFKLLSQEARRTLPRTNITFNFSTVRWSEESLLSIIREPWFETFLQTPVKLTFKLQDSDNVRAWYSVADTFARVFSITLVDSLLARSGTAKETISWVLTWLADQEEDRFLENNMLSHEALPNELYEAKYDKWRLMWGVGEDLTWLSAIWSVSRVNGEYLPVS